MTATPEQARAAYEARYRAAGFDPPVPWEEASWDERWPWFTVAEAVNAAFPLPEGDSLGEVYWAAYLAELPAHGVNIAPVPLSDSGNPAARAAVEAGARAIAFRVLSDFLGENPLTAKAGVRRRTAEDYAAEAGGLPG